MSSPSSLGLAVFGTFDVENYGDILYPLVFERMFHDRGLAGALHKISLRGSNNLRGSGYGSQSMQELLAQIRGPNDSLVIGGGDLIRTDWDRLASHYCSDRTTKRSLSTRFTRWFLRPEHRAVQAPAAFRARYLDYPAVGPCILPPDRFPRFASIAYCSCGVPFPFAKSEHAALAASFNRARFIWVRDFRSQRKLVEAGVTRDIHVAPDLVVKLSDYFDRAAEREKGRKLLRQAGVALDRPVLCVQSFPQSSESTLEMIRQLRAYQQRAGCEVVLLPAGWCHGDEAFLARLARKAQRQFKLLKVQSVPEVIAALAASDTFLGTSLHANITAFSFGIPHLFGPSALEKVKGFLAVCELPAALQLESWTGADERLTSLDTIESGWRSSRLRAAKAKVDRVFDLLLRAVNPPAADAKANHASVKDS